MAEYLAIDWERKKLYGVCAQVSRHQITATDSFSLIWPESINFNTDPESAGKWLSRELANLRISTKQVLLCLPREETVVRQLELPNAPDHELPDLVQLQAETKSALPLSELYMDYLPLPCVAEADSRTVQMTTLSRRKAGKIQQVFEVAGLEIQSIGISPVAQAAVAIREESRLGYQPHKTSLIVSKIDGRFELTLVHNRHIVYTHSTQLMFETEEETIRGIRAELSRTMIAAQPLLGSLQLERVWIVGLKDEKEKLAGLLSDRFSCDVHFLDPLSETIVGPNLVGQSDDKHVPYAGPVGMLLARMDDAIETVDFLNPRRTVNRTERSVIQKRIMVVAAIVLVIGFFGVRFLFERSIEKQIATMTLKKKESENFIETRKPLLDSVDTVQEWVDRDLDWLTELEALNKSFPGTEKVYMTQLRMNPTSGDNVGQIQAKVNAKSREDIQDLNKVIDDEGYETKTKAITQSKDPKYGQTSDIDVRLKKKHQSKSQEKK